MKNHSGKLYLRVVAMAVLISFGATMAGHAGGKVAAWGLYDAGQTRLPRNANNAVGIASGGFHNLVLKSDGTVLAWGSNSYGQTNVPPGLSNVTRIAAGYEYSLAVKADGTVAAWGANYCGQTTVPPGLSNVVAVAGGYFHTMALKADGTVVVWYDNSGGQVSVSGGFGIFNVPQGLSNVTAIAASELNSIVLKADGTVLAWGDNTYGQTNVPPGLSNVVAVAAGERYHVALKANGTVTAWGYGAIGQTDVPVGLSNVKAIAAGSFHNLALKSDGTIVSWGYNAYGETNVPAGLRDATAVAAGADHSLAIVADGPPEILQEPGDLALPYTSNAVLTVSADGQEPLSFQWRRNGALLSDSARIFGANTASLTISNAQFADSGTYSVSVSNAFGWMSTTGAFVNVFSPPIIIQQPVDRTVPAGTNLVLLVSVVGSTPLTYQWRLDGNPIANATTTLLSLTNVQSSQSGNYSVVVSNAYGTLESSNALVTVLESPPYILAQPTNRSGFLGGAATFTVNARGSTPLSYQWRFNGVDISGATNVTLTLTSLRYDQSGLYTVAISNAFGVVVSAKAQLSVSQVAAWGSGILAGSLTNVPAGLTNLLAISAGESHLLALKVDGTVAAWGASTRFVSPYGGFTNPATNVPAGLNGVIAIAAGSSHNLAVRSNGTVVAWGDNSYGQTNVPVGLSTVIAVAAGDLHSLALKADGRVVAWGARGTFLPPSSYSALTNVPISLSNVVAIAAGFDRSLALKSDGKVVAWGLSGATYVPANLSNVIAIACGEASVIVRPPTFGDSPVFNLALRADGAVVSWPADGISRPLAPPTGLSNVVAIAAGGHGMALKADGSTVVWGLTNPPPPQGLSNVIRIAAGYGFAAAVAGNGSPFFTLQPVGQTVARGSKVQFHARATGVQPLRYEWQLDGANLPGATNADLTITNAQGMNAGSYRVVASNLLGSLTSATATLTIPFSTNLAAALNATNLAWTTTPTNAAWFAQIRETHDGDVAAQSGRITHNQQSTLQGTVVGPGTLTFWWKVSSEEGYDRLWFSMDYQNWAAWISGETDWRQFTFHVPTGSHLLNWAYTKDGTVSIGQDAGWLDEVVFTPASPLALTAPRLLPDGSFAFGSSDPSGHVLSPENLAFIGVQVSTNLRDWVALPNVCTVTNGALFVRDPDGNQYPRRFYRVVER